MDVCFVSQSCVHFGDPLLSCTCELDFAFCFSSLRWGVLWNNTNKVAKVISLWHERKSTTEKTCEFSAWFLNSLICYFLLCFIEIPESGPDVKFNRRLEGLIEKARSISMPKEKIDSAIKSGTGVSHCIDPEIIYTLTLVKPPDWLRPIPMAYTSLSSLTLHSGSTLAFTYWIVS